MNEMNTMASEPCKKKLVQIWKSAEPVCPSWTVGQQTHKSHFSQLLSLTHTWASIYISSFDLTRPPLTIPLCWTRITKAELCVTWKGPIPFQHWLLVYWRVSYWSNIMHSSVWANSWWVLAWKKLSKNCLLSYVCCFLLLTRLFALKVFSPSFPNSLYILHHILPLLTRGQMLM